MRLWLYGTGALPFRLLQSALKSCYVLVFAHSGKSFGNQNVGSLQGKQIDATIVCDLNGLLQQSALCNAELF